MEKKDICFIFLLCATVLLGLALLVSIYMGSIEIFIQAFQSDNFNWNYGVSGVLSFLIPCFFTQLWMVVNLIMCETTWLPALGWTIIGLFSLTLAMGLTTFAQFYYINYSGIVDYR